LTVANKQFHRLVTRYHTNHFSTTSPAAMHGAQITAWGETPKYTTIPDPSSSSDGLVPITVVATGIHRVVRLRATGTHYTSGPLPHVPGIDGVGTDPNGKYVYFSTLGVSGSFAEKVLLPKEKIYALPDGLDPVTAAAMVNPALSSWMALKTRVRGFEQGCSVLVLGATTASGKIAVKFAKYLGASKVIGAGRNEEALKAVEGLDDWIVLQKDAKNTDFSKAATVDVVLDYVWGPQAAALLGHLKPVPGKGTQFIHIGNLGGAEMLLHGDLLRGKDITLVGSGPGSFSLQQMAQQTSGILEALKRSSSEDIKVFKLENVEQGWKYNGQERVVFAP
jgi:NADPH:quinone reductase-like Zn-dependent oxidoreductase